MTQSIFEPSYEAMKFYFESSELPIVAFDRSGSLTNANKAFTNLFFIGDPESLKGLNLFYTFQVSLEQIHKLNKTNSLKFKTTVDLQEFSDNSGIELTHTTILQLSYKIDLIPDGGYLLVIKKNPTFKENYEKLVQYNEQLSLALNTENVCFWDMDLLNHTFYLSDSFYDWIDYNIPELSNKASLYFDLIHPDDVERYRYNVDAYFANQIKEFFCDYRIRKNNKEYLWLRTTGSMIRDADNRPIRFTGVSINVTSQQEDYEEVNDIERDLQQLFNNRDTGFVLHKIIKDESGNPIDYDYRYVNPGFERITGLSRKKVLGKTASEVYKSKIDKWLPPYAKAAIEGETQHIQDFDDYQKRYLDVIVYQTRPDYFACIFTDISSKLQVEESISRAEKMNSIGQLAGGIAHDFNNHLQIIRSYSDMIKEKLDGNTKDELHEYVDKISLSVNHSSHIIRQLLAFSKGGHYNLKPIDIHLLLHQTKNILNYSINKNIHTQLLLEADNYRIVGDEPMLQNALINMCLNSRDALKNGGIIQIMTENISFPKDTTMGNETLEAGMYLKMSIRDNGDGIAKEDLPHIFEPFYTTKPTLGTGMGLAAVYGTIRNHKGAITVASNPGEWTNFDIYLRVSDEEVIYPSYDEDKEEKSSDFTSYKILLVDDEPVISLVIKQFLFDLGHDIQIFTSPISALEHLHKTKESYDLFILDVIMPDMTGFELLKEILVLEPKAKAIFLSGYFNPEEVDDSLKGNIMDFIEKPVKLTELNSKIQQVLA